jgi:hypothetical protein
MCATKNGERERASNNCACIAFTRPYRGQMSNHQPSHRVSPNSRLACTATCRRPAHTPTNQATDRPSTNTDTTTTKTASKESCLKNLRHAHCHGMTALVVNKSCGAGYQQTQQTDHAKSDNGQTDRHTDRQASPNLQEQGPASRPPFHPAGVLCCCAAHDTHSSPTSPIRGVRCVRHTTATTPLPALTRRMMLCAPGRADQIYSGARPPEATKDSMTSIHRPQPVSPHLISAPPNAQVGTTFSRTPW